MADFPDNMVITLRLRDNDPAGDVECTVARDEQLLIVLHDDDVRYFRQSNDNGSAAVAAMRFDDGRKTAIDALPREPLS
jgi:hypothetical protein